MKQNNKPKKVQIFSKKINVKYGQILKYFKMFPSSYIEVTSYFYFTMFEIAVFESLNN